MKKPNLSTTHNQKNREMKRFLFSLAARFCGSPNIFLITGILSLFTLKSHAQLIGWDAANNGGGFGASPWAPVSLDANLTMSGTGLIRGASILASGTPASSCWGGSGGWGTTDAASVYFSFTANAGYRVSLSSITSALRRSTAGPASCNIEFSLNGGTYTTAGTWNVTSTSGTAGTANSTALTSFSALQNIAAGTVVRFRITYPSSSGNWYVTGSTNCLKLNGTVTAVSSCTTPTGLVASNIAATSAEFNWNSITGITGYEYTLDQTSGAPVGSGTAITANSYSVTGLTPATVYYMHVRTNCGSSSFSGWATCSFTTALACTTPTVMSLTGNSPLCTGSSLNLLLSASGTGPLTYTWAGTGNFSSVNVNNPTVTNAATGDYSVTISNACGTATGVVSVTVSPFPAVSVTSATLCSGQSATITAAGATSYTWSTTENTNSITVTPVVSTTYTVTGASGGCSDTVIASVTVINTPTITVNSTTLCSGQQATLTAAGGLSYTWSTTENTTSVTVTPVLNTTYTVTGDVNGCANTATATVTVLSLPVVTANSATVCAGSRATLTALGADAYTWSTSQNTQSITVNPSATVAYTVTGTDANACVNTFTTSVTVNALPVITVNSPTICTGTTATLTASGADTYTWSTSQNTQSITVNPSATVAYTVTGTDANTCVNTFTTSVTVNPLPVIMVNSPTICAGNQATLTASGAYTYTLSNTQHTSNITVSPVTSASYTVTGTGLTGCVSTLTVNVTVNPMSVLTVNSSTICAGNTATLTAGGATTYTWSTNSTNATISISPVSTTVYTVSGSSACPGTLVKTATVTVNALPIVSVTPVIPLCSTSSPVSLTGTPVGGIYSGTGITGNIFNPVTAGAGTFTLSYSVIGANNCSNTAYVTVTVNTCTGIEEISNTNFSIYPNPAYEFINVKFETQDLHTVEIYNALGNLVYSVEASGTILTINTGNFSKGIYFLKTKIQQMQTTSKFIVQ